MIGFRRKKPKSTTEMLAAGKQNDAFAPKHVGELLLHNGQITQEQLDEALEEQQKSHAYLGRILVQHKFVTQDTLTSSLVKHCKIPHLSLMGYDINNDVLNLVPQEICEKYHLLPIDKLRRILTIAMVDPLNADALNEVKQACPELRIKPILCNWQHFEQAYNKVFGKKSGRSVTMQSFGFAPSASQAAKQSPPTPPPEPQPTRPANTPEEKAPVTEQAPPEVQQQAIPTPATPSRDDTKPDVPEPPISSNELTENIRQSIQEAFHETTEVLNTHLNALHTARSSADQPALDIEQLGQVFKSSVREAMHEVMSSATQPNALENTTSPSLPIDQLSNVMRDAISEAMQDAMGAMSAQMRGLIGSQTAQTGGSVAHNGVPGPVSGQAQDMLVSALQSGLQEVVEATRAAHSQQESRLAALAEATLQSVQQTSHMLESSVVSQNNQSDLQRGRQGHQKSVTPFKNLRDPAAMADAGTGATTEYQEDADAQVREALESEHPLETLTFDTFIPGSANEFTFRLSKAVSQHPGGDYNPYFLFGHVGIGKTHLISAMGNAILQLQPQLRVGYVSASHFSKRLSEAIKDEAVNSFREGYCHWDVLILDDIQFLGGRVEAQEEFFHIFNVLYQQSRQIIIAGDKAPDRLGLLEERLISRFASGIVAELKAPEWESRMAILRMYAEATGVAVPEEILSLIAMRVPNDIRKMTGSLRKVLAYADLVGQDMTCELANDILSHLGAINAA